jgi:hypothetical protein
VRDPVKMREAQRRYRERHKARHAAQRKALREGAEPLERFRTDAFTRQRNAEIEAKRAQKLEAEKARRDRLMREIEEIRWPS